MQSLLPCVRVEMEVRVAVWQMRRTGGGGGALKWSYNNKTQVFGKRRDRSCEASERTRRPVSYDTCFAVTDCGASPPRRREHRNGRHGSRHAAPDCSAASPSKRSFPYVNLSRPAGLRWPQGRSTETEAL